MEKNKNGAGKLRLTAGIGIGGHERRVRAGNGGGKDAHHREGIDDDAQRDERDRQAMEDRWPRAGQAQAGGDRDGAGESWAEMEGAKADRVGGEHLPGDM